MAMFSLKPNRYLRFEWSPNGAALYQVYFDGVPMLYARDPASFEKRNAEYFGQFVGPVAGRIQGGQVKGFTFPVNEHGNALHSSAFSWCFEPFEHTVSETEETYIVSFRREGKLFGGMYQAEADYILSKTEPSFSLRLRFSCTADCPCNLTSHLYFNLGEEDMSKIRLTAQNDGIMTYDPDKLPLGFVPPTGFYDFSKGQSLSHDYDHALRLSSPAIEAVGGRYGIRAYTNEKAVVLYTDMPSKQASGASKGFTLEFVRHPMVGEEIVLPAGQTEIVAMDYAFFKI